MQKKETGDVRHQPCSGNRGRNSFVVLYSSMKLGFGSAGRDVNLREDRW